MKITDLITNKESWHRELNEAEFNPSRRGFLKKAGAVAASAAMPKGLAGAAIDAVTPTIDAPMIPIYKGLTRYLSDIKQGKFFDPVYDHDPEGEIKLISKVVELIKNNNSIEALATITGRSDIDEKMDRVFKDEYQIDTGWWDTLTKTSQEMLPEMDPEDVNEFLDNLRFELNPVPQEQNPSNSLPTEKNPSNSLPTEKLMVPMDYHLYYAQAALNRKNSEHDPDKIAVHDFDDDDETTVPGKTSILGRVGSSVKQYVDKNVNDVKSHVKDFYNKPKIMPLALPAPTTDTDVSTSILGRVGRGVKQYVDKNVNDVKSHVKDFYNKPAELPAPNTTKDFGMQIPKQKSKVPVYRKDDDDDKELKRLKEITNKLTINESWHRELNEAEFNPSRRKFLKKAGAVAASSAMPKGLAGAAIDAVTPAAAPAIPSVVSITDKDLHGILQNVYEWTEMPEEIAEEIMNGGGQHLTSDQAAYLKQTYDDFGFSYEDMVANIGEGGDELLERMSEEYLERIGQDPGYRREVDDDREHDMDADYFYDDGTWAGNSEWDEGNNWDNEIDWDAEEDEYDPFEDHEVIDQLQKSYHLTPAEAKRTFEYGLRHFRPRRGVWSSFLYGSEDVMGWTEKYGYDTRPPDSAIPGGPDKPSSAVGKIARRIGSVVGQAAKKYVDKNVDDVKSHVKDFYNKPTSTPPALPAPTKDTDVGMQIPKQKSKVSAKQDDNDDKELERLKEMINRVNR